MEQTELAAKLFEPFLLPAGNPMENWEMDEMFITQALMQAETAEIVSFDIFDTALTRLLNSPVDAFAEVERRLLNAFGKTAKGFAAAREQAEQIARRRQHEKNGAEEITFTQIYAELPALLPKFTEIATAAEVECFVEKQLLQAVPDILELTRRLTAIDKPWVFVSDMYLPGKFLTEILENVGYTGWQALYVSSETQCTKASGNIWNILIPEDQSKKKWLHIGDDLHADIENPKNIGINTFAYRRVISDRRVGSKLDPHLLPFSRFKRHLDLQDAAQNARTKTTEQFWYRLGQIMGGMTLVHFVQWLVERIQLHQIEALYFCARDGYLMKRAWEVSGLADTIPVKTYYLYISRAALNIVSGMRLSHPNRLTPELIDFLTASDGKKTVGEALNRAGLSEIKILRDDAKNVFGSLNEILIWPKTVPQFRELLRKHSRVIYKHLIHTQNERQKALILYLRQNNLLNNQRKAMVDMGWHGTMQCSLNELIKGISENQNHELMGFYYGLWSPAKGNRFFAGLMESCFASDFAPIHSQCELWQAVAFLEQLHSADEGTTRYYQINEGGKAEPVLAKNESERLQYKKYTHAFQEGSLDTVTRIFHYRDLPISLSEIDKDAVLAMLGSFILSPTYDEMGDLLKLGHCSTFDHDSHNAIVEMEIPNSFDRIEEITNYSDWIIGQFIYWWINSNEDQRKLLQDFINHRLSYFPQRVLKQFI